MDAEPKADLYLILNAAGISVAKAREIKNRYEEHRVRRAAAYACANAKSNLAGLLLSALENPEWTA